MLKIRKSFDMIVEIYISSESHDEVLIPNGINLKMYRVSDEDDVTIKLENDAGEKLLPFSFELNFEELKKAILKLEY